ncbi:hypothetical protein AB0J63_26730 [Streptosporangium canum]|uniref:hypothetical protein n=1 Tax=Streptosporangium canum TaxID=324952 RepID=UPI00341D68BB
MNGKHIVQQSSGHVGQNAALTVADHARDADDCALLLDMLGLLPEKSREAQQKLMEHQGGGRGSFSAYLGGCRCNACRAANAAVRQRDRQRAKADPRRADRAGHGKDSTYKNHGCRCDACRAAHAAWSSAYKVRRRQMAA